jgi:GNAT superfamily N-acetyltransferase
MCSHHERHISIRRCTADEYAHIGKMLVQAYASLPGMPQPHEQPDYYEMLADVGKRDGNPSIRVFVAASEFDAPVGSIDFIGDMRHYGTAGAASCIPNAAGIRLLAVRPDWRGAGIGKALTRYCVEYARTLRRSRVILHTTRVMRTAWSMYEHMGFERFPEIDFQQGTLQVFGFKLELGS